MNQNLLIIDAHVHTYPHAEIGRQALGPKGYGYSGTIPELKEVMQQSKISYSVMANFTPIREMIEASTKLSPSLDLEAEDKAILEIHEKMIDRMKRRNRWTCEAANENPNLVALISVDILQKPEEMVGEVEEKVKELGAKGLKLHPMGNGYSPCDKRMWPLYSKAEKLGIPILFHTGKSSRPGYESKYGLMNNFEQVAKRFPDLIIILAHLGKGSYRESIDIARRCHNVFFDTSTCFYDLGSSTDELTLEIYNVIRAIGTDRVMFGTDWPWYDPRKDIPVIEKMDLSYEEKAAIFGLTAKKVFRL